MEVWQLVIYGLAALLALRTLAGLMTAHKQSLLDTIAAEEERHRRAEEARRLAEKEKAALAAKKKAKGPEWPASTKSAAASTN